MTFMRRVAICLALSVAAVGCVSDAERDGLRDAALYAYAPYQYALNTDRLRQEAADSGIKVNEIAHSRTLADHTTRRVTTPNADTLYSSAVLNLSTGPVELEVPAAGERYLSVMLMDIFTDVVTVIDPRETKGAARRYWIAGPDWDGETPDGVAIIRAPGPDAWLLGRIFVSGPDDLDTARRVQSALHVRPLPGTQPVPFDDTANKTLSDTPEAGQALTRVNALLARAPGHPHTARAAAFAEQGIAPDETDAWEAMSRIDRRKWKTAFDRVGAGLKAALSGRTARGGWTQPPAHLARFGTDDTVRAAVSLIGFGAMRVEDATYFTAELDADEEPLSGEAAYTVTLDPDAVPVDGFWSMSVYTVEPDGRRFFTQNPLGRHSVNGATPGLALDDEGRLTLTLSADAPGPDGKHAASNWMPVPKGRFVVIFRAYLPRGTILDGRWTPPQVRRTTL